MLVLSSIFLWNSGYSCNYLITLQVFLYLRKFLLHWCWFLLNVFHINYYSLIFPPLLLRNEYLIIVTMPLIFITECLRNFTAASLLFFSKRVVRLLRTRKSPPYSRQSCPSSHHDRMGP